MTRASGYPPAHAAVLVDRDSPGCCLGGGARLLLGSLQAGCPPLPTRSPPARGVEYADFGDELRFGIAELNRPGFLLLPMRSWVETFCPTSPYRLDRGGIILDAGWRVRAGRRSAWPARSRAATVVGFDLDEASVEAARRHIEGGRSATTGSASSRANAADANRPPRHVRGRAGHPGHRVPGAARHGRAGAGTGCVPGGAGRRRRRPGRRRARRGRGKAAPADENERLAARRQRAALPSPRRGPSPTPVVKRDRGCAAHTMTSWVRRRRVRRGHRVLDIEHPFWRFDLGRLTHQGQIAPVLRLLVLSRLKASSTRDQVIHHAAHRRPVGGLVRSAPGRSWRSAAGGRATSSSTGRTPRVPALRRASSAERLRRWSATTARNRSLRP